MSEYPDIVYRSPGAHRAQNGGTFDYMGVNDAGEMKAALADGWHASIDEAVAALVAKADAAAVLGEVAEAADAIDEVSPATRDELERKAKELGVSFNWKTSDEVLAQRIADAL